MDCSTASCLNTWARLPTDRPTVLSIGIKVKVGNLTPTLANWGEGVDPAEEKSPSHEFHNRAPQTSWVISLGRSSPGSVALITKKCAGHHKRAKGASLFDPLGSSASFSNAVHAPRDVAHVEFVT